MDGCTAKRAKPRHRHYCNTELFAQHFRAQAMWQDADDQWHWKPSGERTRLKVRRSTGQIDDDWVVSSERDFCLRTRGGAFLIKVCKLGTHPLEKELYVDDLLALNVACCHAS